MNVRCLLALLVASAACYDAPNPCPPGSTPEAGQCVKFDHVEPPVGSGDAGDDASADDASADAGDTPIDAGDDASDAGITSVCRRDTVAAWTAYHHADSTGARLGPCLDHFVLGAPSAGVACMKSASGVETNECDDCLIAEGTCASDGCNAACGLEGSGGSDEACRACLCETGCAGAFLACAKESLDLCSTNHYGRSDYESAEHGLDRPFVARLAEKSGMFASGILDEDYASSPILQRDVAGVAWSAGFTNLVPFWLAGRPYLLASKAGPPRDGQVNIARISPILKSGELGAPFYAEAWSEGWTEIEVFSAAGVYYLLRYNTQGAPDVQPGTLRIDRIDADLEQRKITLTHAFELPGTSDPDLVWTHLELFTDWSQTYLLLHNRHQQGKVRIDQVLTSPESISLDTVSPAEHPDLAGNFDVIETLPLNDSWFLLAYESTPLVAEEGGVRVYAFMRGLQGPRQERASIRLDQPPQHEGTWPGYFTRVSRFLDADEGLNYMLRFGIGTDDSNADNVFDISRITRGDFPTQVLDRPRVSTFWAPEWTHVEALSNVPEW